MLQVTEDKCKIVDQLYITTALLQHKVTAVIVAGMGGSWGTTVVATAAMGTIRKGEQVSIYTIWS